MRARPLEESFGAWLAETVTLDAERLARVAALVRVKLRRGSDVQKAARIRQAMKRTTDAFTWGALEEDDYRRQLEDLRTQLARSEQAPEEHRILEATRLAQDIPAAWAAASPQNRKCRTSRF